MNSLELKVGIVGTGSVGKKISEEILREYSTLPKRNRLKLKSLILVDRDIEKARAKYRILKGQYDTKGLLVDIVETPFIHYNKDDAFKAYLDKLKEMCNVIFISSGVKGVKGKTVNRNAALENLELTDTIMDSLQGSKQFGNNRLLMCIQNPVDACTYKALKHLSKRELIPNVVGLDHTDTKRFYEIVKEVVKEVYGIEKEIIGGGVYGTHNKFMVPIYSSLLIGGKSFLDEIPNLRKAIKEEVISYAQNLLKTLHTHEDHTSYAAMDVIRTLLNQNNVVNLSYYLKLSETELFDNTKKYRDNNDLVKILKNMGRKNELEKFESMISNIEKEDKGLCFGVPIKFNGFTPEIQWNLFNKVNEEEATLLLESYYNQKKILEDKLGEGYISLPPKKIDIELTQKSLCDLYKVKKKIDEFIKTNYKGILHSSEAKKYNIAEGRRFIWVSASKTIKDYRSMSPEYHTDLTEINNFSSLENGVIAFYIQEATKDTSKFVATVATKINSSEYTIQYFTNWDKYVKTHLDVFKTLEYQCKSLKDKIKGVIKWRKT